MASKRKKRKYSIIRFLIGSFYTLAVVVLITGAGLGAYLVLRARALIDGVLVGGPLSGLLHQYNSNQLYLGAAAVASIGLVGCLVFGSVGQILAMHRDRAMNASLQVQLLEDILELNEEVAKASHKGRVDLCDGCGRLGSLQQIESSQWICRECRRQLRAG
ncbi:MAG TPA: hypothetical protein PKY77_24225 [Phycisphaerae bacterium]|nr:hypothetical protein [Phycisphaerae bacterium]HRY71387.1 hypothetical protein [Phycisphaerae bacterium]HSA29863.1 hypothetical protein [Phycisphaerae bacterium]